MRNIANPVTRRQKKSPGFTCLSLRQECPDHYDFINSIVAGSNYGVFVITFGACDHDSEDSDDSEEANISTII